MRYLIFSFAFLLLASASSIAQSIYNGGSGDGYAPSTCYVQASNTMLSIYNGGNADGATYSCKVQADNTALSIYNGGNADGATNSCYIQADNLLLSIYSGGNADGFATLCFTQADNNLLNVYKGGDADGFSYLCYTQADNNLLNVYKGGDADGFAVTCYLQPDNPFLNIYKGGTADGFAISCVGGVGIEVPLPVELLYFLGTCENKNVLLKWRTASETNNDFFTVERSIDALNFLSAGTVKGAGTTSMQNNYSFTDHNSYKNVSYYRLKQTDFDGKYAYFKIVAVENCSEDGSELMIYPNPAKGLFNLAYNGNMGDFRSIEVFNVLGEKVFTSDSYLQVVDLTENKPGLYFIHFNLEFKSIVEKVVIEK